MQKISNKHLKWIKSLHQKKNRDLEQCFIVEGVKICDEVMRDHPEKIKDIVCTNEYFANISSTLHEKTFTLSQAELSRISALKTPNAVLRPESDPLVLQTYGESFFNSMRSSSIIPISPAVI